MYQDWLADVTLTSASFFYAHWHDGSVWFAPEVDVLKCGGRVFFCRAQVDMSQILCKFVQNHHNSKTTIIIPYENNL